MNDLPSTGIKAAVVGLGPVGLILSAHLKEAGFDVAVCDLDKIKINLVRKEGIRLEGAIQRQVQFDHIYSSIADLREFDPDLVFASIKGYQTPAFVQQLASLDTGKSVFVSAQNGIDVEQIYASALSESRILRLVINFAGNLNAPHVVKVTFFNPPNYLASLDDSRSETVRLIAEAFNRVNLTTTGVSSFEILRHTWEKTILNSSLSALCGIGKLTIKEAMDMPDTVEIIEQVIEEAVEVAEAEKIKFDDEFIRKCMRYLKKAGDHFPSLAVDLINNRQTEIDYMNGKIVEYGRKYYIRTPLNLSMVNMVKAMTQKNIISQTEASNGKAAQQLLNVSRMKLHAKGDCFLGIDLGSAYTKFTVVDEEKNVVFRHLLKTLNRDKVASKHIIAAIHDEFPIRYSCATGYGRKHFPDADMIKTEINCAAYGANEALKGEKNIIDIGGEDIKVIRCNKDGNVENFYLNDKCAAGTGAFLTEIAERAGIDVKEMSRLALQSEFNQELNSFCTVFAKTEIMKWIFDGIPIENVAKGIYLSIGNRVAKMHVDIHVPIIMIGGVIAHHPYIKTLLEKKLGQNVMVLNDSQHVVSYGAALMARDAYMVEKKKENNKNVISKI